MLFDGHDGATLARELGVPAVQLHERVSSTMDVAHDAASRGAPSGTLILANEQVGGRGRGGRRWSSPRGTGLWMTLIERPASAAGLDVLSLRCGLHIAEGLDELADARIHLKWPNDLYIAKKKLAGILIEARWRDQRLEWVAIGVGLNVRPTAEYGSAGLASGATRRDALTRVVSAVRSAAAHEGLLTASELARYSARDLCAGRWITEPLVGVVVGVGVTGDLMVQTDSGPASCRIGSVVFAEDR